jgi:hypothetical protein
MSAKGEKPLGINIRADMMDSIRWSGRGSCGQGGCRDPECCCSLCGLPIGFADDDEDYAWHDVDSCCDPDCKFCADAVPIYMFRGEGKETEEAQFHGDCWKRVMDWRGGSL